LDLSFTCGATRLREVLTALGSGGAGASLTELRLSFRAPLYTLPHGVEMLPGSLPQLRTLSLSVEHSHDTSGESVRSLLLAPGGLLTRLELLVPGAAVHMFEAIADEVSQMCRPHGAGRVFPQIVCRVLSCRQEVPLAWRASLSRLILKVGKERDGAGTAVAVKKALLQLPSLARLKGVPSMSYWVGLLSAAQAGGLKHLTRVSSACDVPLPNAPALLLAAWLKRQVESGATPFSVAGVKVGSAVIGELIKGIALKKVLKLD
jgi:hypothetical protein